MPYITRLPVAASPARASPPAFFSAFCNGAGPPSIDAPLMPIAHRRSRSSSARKSYIDRRMNSDTLEKVGEGLCSRTGTGDAERRFPGAIMFRILKPPHRIQLYHPGLAGARGPNRRRNSLHGKVMWTDWYRARTSTRVVLLRDGLIGVALDSAKGRKEPIVRD
jgi:hypothetical protein